MKIAVFLKIAELTKYFEKVCFLKIAKSQSNRIFWKSLFLKIAVFLKIAELTEFFEKVCFWKSLFFLNIASSKYFLRRPATWTRRKYGSPRMLKNEYVEHNVILEGGVHVNAYYYLLIERVQNWIKLLVEVRGGLC